MKRSDALLTALLGPTNTGKTFYAMERMASYPTGMIGFPLRLLARENYDRLVAIKGRSKVALITGEEKIIPPSPHYYVCTVEAMPVSIPVAFLCVDEIQLCADAERGHIFTDRLLHARGTDETVFLGAATMTGVIRSLLPDFKIETRDRMSPLTYTGHKKISRLPARSAIVAFSVNDVYRIAEMVRMARGGTAIVLGALSPRTRNAQVELYQNGDVDYIVATDAIGMGLNMNIGHVALAATKKFDGARGRVLRADEMAQIAGRAGRYQSPGTFGVTDQISGLDDVLAKAIEAHDFDPITHVRWRNSDLDFKNIDLLLRALNHAPPDDRFMAARTADDHTALAVLARNKTIRDIASSPDMVRLLWDVCAIPDFRKILPDEHHKLLESIFLSLTRAPRMLDDDWCAAQIDRLDRTDGDLDTLLMRIAHIRTWTYITHVKGWVRNSAHWQAISRLIEDRLSDALHEKLTQRFVDRRTSSLLRSLATRDTLAGGIRSNGDVIVEGHRIGQFLGWHFMADDTLFHSDGDALMKTARAVLREPLVQAVTAFADAPFDNMALAADGTVTWTIDGTACPVARLGRGNGLLAPRVVLLHADLLDDVQTKVAIRKLDQFVSTTLQKNLAPLFSLEKNEVIGAAKGIAFQLYESGGVMLREKVQDLLAPMTKEERVVFGNLGVRIGAYYLYQKDLLKPAALHVRAVLWRVFHGLDALPTPLPPQGNVSMPCPDGGDRAFYMGMGFPVFGKTCVRVDMVERLNSAVYDGAKDGKYVFDPALASVVGVSVEVIQFILRDLGFRHDDITTGEGDDAKTIRHYHIKRKPPRLDTGVKKQAEEKPRGHKKDNNNKDHKKKTDALATPKAIAPTGYNAFAALSALKK
jgi:ATP-dependent RNA helicase SUPV3L1/SUV3